MLVAVEDLHKILQVELAAKAAVEMEETLIVHLLEHKAKQILEAVEAELGEQLQEVELEVDLEL